MYTKYKGDTIRFSLKSRDTQLGDFNDHVVYVYNSVKDYKVEKGISWKFDENDKDKIIVTISPSETVNMITGSYNVIVKCKAYDSKAKINYLCSGKAVNIFILEESPARKEFVE